MSDPSAPPEPAPAAAATAVPDDRTLDHLLARYAQGHHAEVHAAALALTQRAPEFGFGWKLLGVVAQRLGRMAESLDAKQRAARLLPEDAEAHNNLGNTLSKLGRLDEAEAALRRAITLQPRFAESLNNLGLVLQQLGRLQEADALFQRAVACRPDFAEAHSNRLFLLSHNAEVPAAQVLAAHIAFDQQHGLPLRSTWRAHDNLRDPHKRLRIGFVSGDLRQHAVAHFIAPIWRAFDRRTLAIVAYHNSPKEDAVTQALRGLCDGWLNTTAMSDAALADTVRRDGIDILVDLSGHTRLNRLLVFARKPAPVQVTGIGYPHTTGLSAMDYRISDAFRMPAGLDAQYVEKVVRIPCSGAFAHGPAPEVQALPALHRGGLTFGSFQRPAKINTASLALWGRVLRALPTSRMLIGALGGADAQQRVRDALRAEGVDPSRLDFQPPMKMPDYLALHHQVDMLLDTHPYPGGTTVHHALWMGVPTVARVGESVVSWQSAATLLRLGLDDWVAQDDDEYLAIAQRWAADLPALAALRAGLRERIRHHPLQQPETVACGMQAALRAMWQRWCAGQPVESFDVSLA